MIEMATSRDNPPDLGAAADRAPEAGSLAKAYRLVAELFVNPEQTVRRRLVTDARQDVIPAIAADINEETAAYLRSFLDEYESMSVEAFIEAHELSPACPFYLGHYAFDEPETCREIADTDRNQYMVELSAIFEHFGFAIDDELPDYLPAMVEFCWLTLPERDDELRSEFQRMVLTLLPGMRERFEDHGTPYRLLLDVVDQLLRFDLTGDTTATVETPDSEELDGLSMVDGTVGSSGGDS